MSPVSEAIGLYIDEKSKLHPFYGVMVSTPRRLSYRHRQKMANAFVDKMHMEWVDEKRAQESLYTSSEDERFKQDVLPDIIKKLEL